MISKECFVCGIIYKTYKNKPKIYCSRNCSFKDQGRRMKEQYKLGILKPVKHTNKTKETLSKVHLGRVSSRKGITYEEQYGIEKAKIMKKRCKNKTSRKGKTYIELYGVEKTKIILLKKSKSTSLANIRDYKSGVRDKKSAWNKGRKILLKKIKSGEYKPQNNHGGRILKEIGFRSTWEKAFSDRCKELNIKVKYEPKCFDLGYTTYTPDFYLPEYNLWIEVKGYLHETCLNKTFDFQLLGNNVICLLKLEDCKTFEIKSFINT